MTATIAIGDDDPEDMAIPKPSTSSGGAALEAATRD